MGRDKAFLEIEGVPLWQRQVQILKQLAPAEVFLAGPFRSEWNDAGCTIVADAQRESGPLAGLVGAMRSCSTSFLLALAVDVPHMTSDYLRELLAVCTSEKGVVPFADRFEPLVAVYPIQALRLAEELLLSATCSLQNFARRCVAGGLMIGQQIRPANAALFLNMNTPAQFSSVAAVYDRRTRQLQPADSAARDRRYK